MDFRVSSTKISETQEKQEISINLKFGPSQTFFFVMNESYRSWLPVAVVPQNGSDMFFEFCEPSYSEQEAKELLQSGISLSFKLQIPKKIENIRVVVLNPFRPSYGIQAINIEP
jgi:hypothetical protein